MERIAGTRQRASYRLVIWVQPDMRDLPVPARLPAWKTGAGSKSPDATSIMLRSPFRNDAQANRMA